MDKRSLLFVLAISFLISHLSGQALLAQDQTPVQASLSEEEKLWIKQHPLIRLGGDPTFAPFEFFDGQGVHQGMAADYAQLIRERTKLNLVIQPHISWQEVIARMQRRENDLVAAVGKTRERETYLNFSKSYSSFRRVILMRTDAPKIQSIDDLQGKIVGVHSQSSHHGFMKDTMPNLPLAEFDTFTEVLTALSDGTIDAAIGNGVVSVFHSRNMGLVNIKVATPASSTEYTVHFGGRKDWPELISIIDKGLATITSEEHSAIRKRWTISEKETDYKLIWQAFAVFIPFLLLAIGWALYARSQQKKLQIAEEKHRHAAKEAVAANRAKSTFLATMSHELRTPMAGVIGLTDLLLKSQLSSQQQDWAYNIRDAGKRLMTILNEILDQSKLEAGMVEIDPYDLHLPSFINSIAQTFMPKCQEIGIGLNIELDDGLPEGIFADGLRIGQILTNLLSNAVKFTKSGDILVRVKSDKIEDAMFKLTFSIADEGVGIDAETLKTLFKPFVQADGSTSREYGGTGLGLSISKQLTELMGGEIGVESHKGKGSKFWFTISCRSARGPVEAPAENSHQDQWRASRSLKILAAEDNIILQQLISALLMSMGHKVTIAGNGKMAVDLYKTGDFDLILMDIRMPEMDGLEATRIIRTMHGDKATIPIIALTADLAGIDIKEYRLAGMDDVCAKPIDVPMLLTSINNRFNEEIHTAIETFEFAETPPCMNEQQKDPTRYQEESNFSEMLEIISAMSDSLQYQGAGVSQGMQGVVAEKMAELCLNYEGNSLKLSMGLVDASAKLKKDPAAEDIRQEMTNQTHDLAGSGGTFGYDLVSQIARIAYELLKKDEPLNSDDIRVVERCSRALALIAEKKIMGNGGKAGSLLLKHIKFKNEEI